MGNASKKCGANKAVNAGGSMLKFCNITEDDLELILSWRTKENVTKYMFSDVENDISAQRQWFQRISADSSCRYWMIHFQNQPIGVIGITDIDRNHKRCSLAYYIGNDTFRGIGGIIPPYVYNYIFQNLNMNKIVAEVMEGNEQVMKLHLLYGYRQVGVYKQHIFKYDTFHDVSVFELLKTDWENSAGKYKKCVASFES